MRGLVHHGPGDKAWEEVPEPEVTDEADDIIRVEATTICGTDLHILAGDVPEVRPGRVLGHEAVGTVCEVRVPYAETSTYRIPAGVPDEKVLMLADISPRHIVSSVGQDARPFGVPGVPGAVGPDSLRCRLDAFAWQAGGAAAFGVDDRRVRPRVRRLLHPAGDRLIRV